MDEVPFPRGTFTDARAREIEPVAPPRRIIQLVVSRTSLIALTAESEIWVLHGFDSVAAGGGGYPPEIKWRLLGVTLPPTNEGVETLPRW